MIFFNHFEDQGKQLGFQLIFELSLMSKVIILGVLISNYEIENDAQGVDIEFFAIERPFPLIVSKEFWCCILMGKNWLIEILFLVLVRGSKVTEYDMSSLVKKQILQFQIPMINFVFEEKRDRIENVSQNLNFSW